MQGLSIGTMVEHDRYGEGIIGKINLTSYEIYFAHGGRITISKESDELNSLSGTSEESAEPTINLTELEELFNYLLDKKGMLSEEVTLGEKWEGGTLVLSPGNQDLQPKEIPIETFFHKIVMVRDKLRVLEQSINSHKKLTDEDKVHIQQYITKAYGSLTTFNILFSDKKHYFNSK